MPRRVRGLARVACLGALACGAESDSQQPGEQEGSADTLTWRPCGGVECAELRVPLDPAAPEAGSIFMAVNRVRANRAVPYRGVLLVNPGGPGLAGKPFLANSAAAFRAGYPDFDVIGFDPRGVGDSAGLRCEVGIDTEQLYAEGGVQAAVEALRAEARRCAAQDGELFQHIGSKQVVADIESLRAALGVEQINFLGISFGTRLGALYAQSFPDHIRALVLDAPFAPRADLVEVTEQQFTALSSAHAGFFEDCTAGVLQCPPDAEQVFLDVLAAAEQEGIAAPFLAGWKLLLASPPGREQLALVLTNVALEAQGQVPTEMAMPEDYIPAINVAANYTIHCADNVRAPPTLAEAEALMASFEARSSLFGRQGWTAFTCAGWEVTPDPVPALGFAPAVPPLVIGGVEDLLTPLSWAEETAQLIEGASLLESEHYGHGATAFGGRCVGQYLRNYITDLRPIPPGTRCPPP